MGFNFKGREIATDERGYLLDHTDWSEELAEAMAEAEGITLTEKHWDIINYLRDEYFNNNGNQPNTRTIIKAMSDKWGEKVKQKDVYELFPLDPSKQAGRIAGLPESRRKGGY